MRDDRGASRTVDWRDIQSWLTLLARSFRIAIAPRVLLLAAIGLALTTFGWWGIGKLFSNEPGESLKARIESDSRWPGVHPEAAALTTQAVVVERVREFAGLPVDSIVGDNTRDPVVLSAETVSGQRPNPYVSGWAQVSSAFRSTFEDDIRWRPFIYLLLCALWSLLVWSLFGAAITRIAALGLARDERVGLTSSLRYARSKWASYFTAPLIPLAGVVLATLPLALFGLLLRNEAIGVLFAALLWPLVLLGGLFMAAICVGLAFGWPLMWATISTEGTDSFDALSRSYSYVYQRPLHYFVYAVLVSLIGILGWVLVSIIANTIVQLSWWAVSWGSGFDAMNRIKEEMILGTNGESFGTGVQIISFWNGCLWTVVHAFPLSFFWAASTAIYLLLRWHVDQTEIDEVALDEEEPTYGLPPLAPGPGGVPTVAAERPSPAPQPPSPVDDDDVRPEPLA